MLGIPNDESQFQKAMRITLSVIKPATELARAVGLIDPSKIIKVIKKSKDDLERIPDLIEKVGDIIDKIKDQTYATPRRSYSLGRPECSRYWWAIQMS